MYIGKAFLPLSKSFYAHYHHTFSFLSQLGLARRTLSTTTATTPALGLKELDPLHQGLKFAKVPNRHLLEMEGPDSAKFLQGLITNHMPLISAGGDGFYTAFLTPQGRTLYDAFVYPVNVGENFPHQKYILDFSSIDGRSLLKHLKLYMLRSKIKIKDVTSDYTLYHLWGSSLPPKPTTPEVSAPAGTLIKRKTRWSDIGCVDPRVSGFGYRAVISNDQDVQSMLPSKDYCELPSDEYTIRRLLQGIPEGPGDIWPEQSLPLESNIDYMNGVDFRKGCYVGQELTIRTYHTGVVRKRIVPVQFYKDGESVPDSQFVDRNSQLTSTCTAQSDIRLADGSSKRSVGKTCAGIHNIGLSLMRLEHVEKAVAGESIGFKVADSDLLLRPFLPSWWPSS